MKKEQSETQISKSIWFGHIILMHFVQILCTFPLKNKTNSSLCRPCCSVSLTTPSPSQQLWLLKCWTILPTTAQTESPLVHSVHLRIEISQLFPRLILCRSPAEDLARFWSSSSRHGGLRCVMAAGGESRAGGEPTSSQLLSWWWWPQRLVAMGDGSCLSDPSPLVLSPALLIHAAARHCGSTGGRVKRTAVNEFRRNRDSPPLLFILFPHRLPSFSPSFLMDVCHVQWCLRNVGLSWSITAKYSFSLTHTHTGHPPPHTHTYNWALCNDMYTPIRHWHCTH